MEGGGPEVLGGLRDIFGLAQSASYVPPQEVRGGRRKECLEMGGGRGNGKKEMSGEIEERVIKREGVEGVVGGK